MYAAGEGVIKVFAVVADWKRGELPPMMVVPLEILSDDACTPILEGPKGKAFARWRSGEVLRGVWLVPSFAGYIL